VHYRVVGIAWGGSPPADRLAIRFGSDDAWKPVSICSPRSAAGVWTLWEYRWTPPAAGVYSIALRIPDASIPQRRLDAGYYIRWVSVDAR